MNRDLNKELFRSRKMKQVNHLKSKTQLRTSRVCPSGSHSGPTKRQVRIALIDTDQDFYFGLKKEFEKRHSNWILDYYLDIDEALQRITVTLPRAVLIDIAIDGARGSDYIRRLGVLIPNLPIVVVTTSSEARGILRAFMAGARGYIVKPIPVKNLVSATRDAARGIAVMCSRATKALIRGLNEVGAQASHTVLSPREHEIISLILARNSDKDIAKVLHITPGTVHVHLANMFKKLRAHNRNEAVTRFLGL